MDTDKLLVETERIRSVLQQAPLTLLVTVINAVLTSFVLAPVTANGFAWIWTGLNVAISIIRFALRQVFFRRNPRGPQVRPWAVASIMSSLTTGLLWGVGTSVLFPSLGNDQLFLAFVIGGMCAGTTTVNSAHWPTVWAFVLPASLPLAARFLFDGSMPQVVSALMIVIFAAALSLTAMRAHRDFGNRIRFQLVLSREQQKLRATNRRLREQTAQKQQAEAELFQARKIEAIGHLTGGIAHDFNNLLHVVTGNLSRIRHAAENNNRVLSHVGAAEQAAQQGAHLVNSLLTFARRQALQSRRANIGDLLEEFQPILLRATGEKVRLDIVTQADLPYCQIDPTHFASAVLNLVINACDAMPHGGAITISPGTTTLTQDDLLGNPNAEPGRFVTLLVKDNGLGMEGNVLAKAFEPFFTTKDVGKGSGLGLSQVFGFARQSRGHLRLRSTPGAGTCVTLFLPALD